MTWLGLGCGDVQYVAVYSYVERSETGSSLNRSSVCWLTFRQKLDVTVYGSKIKPARRYTISIAVNP